MDSVIYLEHLSSLISLLGLGFFVFGNFKEMPEIFGLFLLLAFGFKSFHSLWFPTNSGSRKSKNITDAKSNIKIEKIDSTSDYDSPYDELERDRNSIEDVSALRKKIKMERRRAKAAKAELERERAASATAAQEAMAMIQRLQREKSSIEMESTQYRRVAEAKRVHDEEVIRSLEWLLFRFESEMSLSLEELSLCEDVYIN